MAGFLSFENISKTFGKQTVLSDVSFSVEKGKIFSLLGSATTGSKIKNPEWVKVL